MDTGSNQKKNENARTTIYINKSVYKKFKILSIEQNKSVSELIETFMKKEISKNSN